MAEMEYRNRSISQLVSELNNLGEAKVVLEPVRLLAVHEFDLPHLKRFKNSHGEQFFIVENNEKKYIYNEIVQRLISDNFRLHSELLAKGFSVSLLLTLPREQTKLSQLLAEVVRITGEAAYSAVNFGQHEITEGIGEVKLGERDLDRIARYYRVKGQNAIVFLDGLIRRQGKAITLLRIRMIRDNKPSNNEFTLVVLPEQFFSSLKANEYLAVVKSQLTQIFNFIKLNPAKKYQHFSKLLTKRLPVTNAIASLVLEESLSMALNWVSQGDPSHLSERFLFYQKIRGLTAFLKIEDKPLPVLLELPSHLSSEKIAPKKQTKKISRAAKTERTPVADLQSQENELEYCRSFQRKTHKYSIIEENQGESLFSGKVNQYEGPSEFTFPLQSPSPVTHPNSERPPDRESQRRGFDQTVAKKWDPLKQSEEIAILKAKHAVQISQYHQTIQQLNKKVLALSSENQLAQLYTIHERELMLLELKIKELRDDIQRLTAGGEEKTYKAMVRKQNEEIKRLEVRISQQKLSSGRIAFLEKELQETTKKYQESENSRKKLAYQLQYLTKRLKICDAQIEQLNMRGAGMTDNLERQPPAQSTGKLSSKDAESLREVEVLVESLRGGSEQSGRFLVRKVTNVLQDLASCRNLLLECNDFLVQLEEHLQERLGGREPQIVLDCNKFIRNFLMDNLTIF